MPVVKLRVRACTELRMSFSAARPMPACTAMSTSWKIEASGSLGSSGMKLSTGTWWNSVVPVPVSPWPKPSQSSRIFTPLCWVETTAIWRPGRSGWDTATVVQSAKMVPVQ